MNQHHTNLVRIRAVSRHLGALADDVVFVGGATVSLYATNAVAEAARPTDDVDIVVEVANYGAYADLENQLRSLGFENDQVSGVICRYRVDGLIVDVMPTSEDVLGFRNKWYTDGFHESIRVNVGAGTTVRIFSAPYFLAAKLEAFRDRGNNDGRTSNDFEDITSILNNRPEIWVECAAAPVSVQDYLRTSFAELLRRPSIEEWLSCHLEYGFEEEQAQTILTEMRKFVNS